MGEYVLEHEWSQDRQEPSAKLAVRDDVRVCESGNQMLLNYYFHILRELKPYKH